MRVAIRVPRRREAGQTLVVIAALAGCIETGAPEPSALTFGRSASAFVRGDYESAAMAPESAPARPTPMTQPTPGVQTGMGGAPSPGPGAGAVAAAGSNGTNGMTGAGGAGPSAAGSGGMAQAPMPMQPTGPAEGTLRVAFTSVDGRGRYSPRNCGAVWIETAEGKFVKTIERWCGIRAYYLRRWTAASGGWGGSRGGFPRAGSGTMTPANPADQMDAISSGTLRMHIEHESTWKLHDVAGELVPDGDYKVVIEVSDGTEKSLEVPFKKGRESMQAMPADAAPCSGLAVEYQPAP